MQPNILLGFGTIFIGIFANLIARQDETVWPWVFFWVGAGLIFAAAIWGAYNDYQRNKQQRKIMAKLDELLRRTYRRKHWNPGDWRRDRDNETKGKKK